MQVADRSDFVPLTTGVGRTAGPAGVLPGASERGPRPGPEALLRRRPA